MGVSDRTSRSTGNIPWLNVRNMARAMSAREPLHAQETVHVEIV
jgi:hypothetical protein